MISRSRSDAPKRERNGRKHRHDETVSGAVQIGALRALHTPPNPLLVRTGKGEGPSYSYEVMCQVNACSVAAGTMTIDCIITSLAITRFLKLHVNPPRFLEGYSNKNIVISEFFIKLETSGRQHNNSKYNSYWIRYVS